MPTLNDIQSLFAEAVRYPRSSEALAALKLETFAAFEARIRTFIGDAGTAEGRAYHLAGDVRAISERTQRKIAEYRRLLKIVDGEKANVKYTPYIELGYTLTDAQALYANQIPPGYVKVFSDGEIRKLITADKGAATREANKSDGPKQEETKQDPPKDNAGEADKA